MSSKGEMSFGLVSNKWDIAQSVERAVRRVLLLERIQVAKKNGHLINRQSPVTHRASGRQMRLCPGNTSSCGCSVPNGAVSCLFLFKCTHAGRKCGNSNIDIVLLYLRLPACRGAVALTARHAFPNQAWCTAVTGRGLPDCVAEQL